MFITEVLIGSILSKGGSNLEPVLLLGDSRTSHRSHPSSPLPCHQNPYWTYTLTNPVHVEPYTGVGGEHEKDGMKVMN